MNFDVVEIHYFPLQFKIALFGCKIASSSQRTIKYSLKSLQFFTQKSSFLNQQEKQ